MSADTASRAGLSTAEAAARLARDGPNALSARNAVSPWRLFLSQFASTVVWLLIAAAAAAAVMGEWIDGAAILVIVVLNALVGFYQEYRAERAMEALRAVTAPRARVVREGRMALIPAPEVVAGDVMALEGGDIVAADARLLDAHSLSVNEALLTGESLPVEKHSGEPNLSLPLAERNAEVFAGTAVAAGTGLALVLATGMTTQLGRIAGLLAQAHDEQTPLQKRLAGASRALIAMCLAVVALVGVLGLLRGMPLFDVLLLSVSLAVAAVPEGLPAIVTVALALGVGRMTQRHVLVRRLSAVETLGCTTVICTDKTGTLTTGIMAVRELWGRDYDAVLGAAAAVCDAELGPDGRTGVGDPTEVAILAAAAVRGIARADIDRANPRSSVQPFDSERKRMSILRADGVLYLKGAVEVVLARAAHAPDGVRQAADEMSKRGLRVLAVATGADSTEQDLRVLGLVGMADPPRTEVVEALRTARAAGIRNVMITGDHPATALAIARELGVVLPGEDPAGLVYARATPDDKLRIIRENKQRGEIVAMTGDGVNDAPALKEAHIGIAMGRGGTEVTREAADIVLTDDNYASIVEGVREGRGIYANIRKSLKYLLAGNLGEVLVVLVAALMGWPLPLLPLHLLWINLVTDGLPALALVTDPPEPDAMKRPPRRPNEPILGRSQWTHIGFTASLQAACTLAVFAWALDHRTIEEARNLAFSTLVFGELFRAFAARSDRLIFWRVGAFTNVRLLAVVVLSAMMQLAIHHIPATQQFFSIGAISLNDCLLSLGVGLIPVTILELAKLVRRPPTGSRRTQLGEG